jgi:hypothetical protein
MLVSGVYPFLATVANGGKVQNANGYDIVFTSDAAGQTPLDFEIDSYNGSNGTAAFWVRIPVLSHTADTTIYMWYGNSNISSSQENKARVWDSNYVGVWHLSEGSGTTAYDSTFNKFNGVWGGSGGGSASTYYSNSSNFAGPYAGFMIGSNNHVATNLDIQPSAMPSITMSAWIYPESTSGNEDVFTDDSGGYARGLESSRGGNGNFNIFTGSGAWTPTGPTLNQWQYVTLVYTPTDILFYKNGVQYDFGSAPTGQSSSNNLWIGGSPGF